MNLEDCRLFSSGCSHAPPENVTYASTESGQPEWFLEEHVLGIENLLVLGTGAKLYGRRKLSGPEPGSGRDGDNYDYIVIRGHV